jgi:hypothetical protein
VQRLPPRLARYQIQERLRHIQHKLLLYHRFRSLKAAIMTTACVKQFDLKMLSFRFARHTQLQFKPQLRAIQRMSLCATTNRRASHLHVLVFSPLRLRLNLPHRPNLKFQPNPMHQATGESQQASMLLSPAPITILRGSQRFFTLLALRAVILPLPWEHQAQVVRHLREHRQPYR